MTMRRSQASHDPLGLLLAHGSLAGAGDARLLELYRSGRAGGDEAFRVLVERHARMVLGVCRSVVRDPAEADDAFQAVFLVLARRAHAIRRSESLGPWLHGVALRVSRRARRSAARRDARCQAVDPAKLVAVPSPAPRPDPSGIVHAELDRLPARYREPLVLCVLEGLSYEEAARTLGLTEPALRGRLFRGRRRLEARLRKQGINALALIPCDGPSPSLVQSVVARAVAGTAAPVSVSNLAKGTLIAMSLSIWKPLALGTLASLGVVATAVLAQQSGGASPAASARQAEPASGSQKPAPKGSQNPAPKSEVPRLPTPEEIEASNTAIRNILARPVDLDFDQISLEDLLKHIRKLTTTPGYPGVPIYVDPLGLSVTGRAMGDSAFIHSKGRPLGEGLSEFLAMFDLGYAVHDGFVMVHSRAAAADRKIDAVEAKLDRLIEALEKAFPDLAPSKAPDAD